MASHYQRDPRTKPLGIFGLASLITNTMLVGIAAILILTLVVIGVRL